MVDHNNDVREFDFPPSRDRTNWVRLRTIILLRWVTIVGQLAALTVAQRVFDMQIEIGLCYLAVGMSIVANLVSIFVFPETKRLPEAQNFLMMLFDLLQIGFLLSLTGGLNNPFALLLLGPVTISAGILSIRYFIIMVATAILITSALTQFYVPLRTNQGFILDVPDIFLYGYWLAFIIAVIFIAAYSRRIILEVNAMSDGLSATQMALAREQKLTDLGGVVAAAAHELGTPLATIKLTSSELMEELESYPELREDAELIRDQADRCRDILRDMGRAGKDDLHLRVAPLSALIEEAAEPHQGRGIDIVYIAGETLDDHANQPNVFRKPEIIHGLRNLIQNAVDFAERQVWIDAEWTEDTVLLRIVDDGPGYPPGLLGRIGDPFMTVRKSSTWDIGAQRSGYEGMGLGLFIAKTLLERTGAELTFANGSKRDVLFADGVGTIGAIVTVSWLRTSITPMLDHAPLGENPKITA